MRVRGMGVLVGIAAALLSTRAAAQPASGGAVAAWDRARDAFARQDWQEARLGFAALYESTRDPQVLQWIAAMHEKRGECPEAVTYYRRYLEEGDPTAAEHLRTVEQIIACGGSPAFAQIETARDPLPPRPPAPMMPPSAMIDQGEAGPPRWYGWKILAADAASILVGIVTQNGLSVLGLLIAAPVVHTVHGNGGAALGSVGLRILLPIGGAFIGGATLADDFCGPGSVEYCEMRGVAVGLAGGLLTAIIIDAAALARKRDGPARTRSVGPSVQFGGNGLPGVGLAGTF